ncbi:unnamed protein product [Cuscuta europaea]|uniref:Uncharacterized protein n=1 Tax=Cuscuta europaea TaxID=41803 RepID=A0A9P0ZUM7_CUSEU|nr:unnamed protein product [Cuscuta europaea]
MHKQQKNQWSKSNPRTSTIFHHYYVYKVRSINILLKYNRVYQIDPFPKEIMEEAVYVKSNMVELMHLRIYNLELIHALTFGVHPTII